MAPRSKKDPAPHVGVPLGDHIEEYLIPPTFDADGVQSTSAIGVDGREYPDPTPMSPPVGYTAPHDLMWMIQHMIEAGRQVISDNDMETEDEANDFDIPDDPLDPLTPYEKVFLPEAPAANLAAPVGAAASSNKPVASPVPETVVSGSPGNAGTPPVEPQAKSSANPQLVQ